MFKWYIIGGWPHTKKEMKPGVERYWWVKYKLPMIDGVAMKGK